MSDELRSRQLIHEAMRAVLSDDHKYERGLASLTNLIEGSPTRTAGRR